MKIFDYSKYNPRMNESNKIDKFMTDSPTLNEYLGGGLRTGNLIILQAPSGIGKTTVMMRLFIRALIAGKKAAYLSIGEQDQNEVTERIACMFKKIDYAKFIDSREEEDCNKIEEFLKKYKDKYFICYDDDPFESRVDHETGKIYKPINVFFEEIRKREIQFIFIDYLGAVMAPDDDSMYSYLTRVASWLKNVATNDNLMIFTAMQTNRQLKFELNQSGFDPSTVDETFMADSIGPARKSSVCMSLFQSHDKYYINIFKNRLNGKLGLVEINFKPLSYEWDEMFDSKERF